MRTFLLVLLIAAIVLIEMLIGGTRLVFSLPAYALLALAALATIARRPDTEHKPSFWCLGISGVFFAYILVRASQSPVHYLWLPDFYMVLAALVVYLLTVFYLNRPHPRGVVICALFALAAVEVLIGLHQFTSGDNWMPFGFLRADSGRRASGMLISSIHLAGLLEVIAVFALSYAFWSAWKMWARILAGYIALVCYLGVAITGSRGGYLSVLFSLAVFAAISLHARRKTHPEKFGRMLAISGVVLALGLILAVTVMSRSELLRSRLSGIPRQLEKNGLDIRIYNWQAALDQFHSAPWLGTGAGTHVYYGRYFRRPPLQSDPIHAHSDYLELLAEYGVIGALGMAAFLFVHLRSGARNYRALLGPDPADRFAWQPGRHNSLALNIGALSAISAYLAHSVVDFNLHVPGHTLIFAFIFGIVASPQYGVPAEGAARVIRVIRWMLPALGAALCVWALPDFPAEYWAEKARVALRNFDFTQSIESAQQALERDEDNPELHFTLGGALRGAGIVADDNATRIQFLEAAVETYQHALALFPQDEHALIRLGETLDSLGRFKEAENAYLAALALDRNLARIHAYYARHLAVVGRAEEAEAQFQTARSMAYGSELDSIVRGTSLDPAAEAP